MPSCGLKRHVVSYLRSSHKRPSKKLGQSFLIDCSVAKRIAYSVWGTVYEIGVGLGSLTFFLSKRAPYVVGIEVDENLARYMWETLSLQNVDLIIGDALHFIPKYKFDSIVSNVPYSISSPLFLHLCKHLRFENAVLMFQKEFAERLLAAPGSKKYGRLTILSSLCFYVEPLFYVKREAFIPSPKIDSLVLKVVKKSVDKTALNLVEEVTRRIFTYRRRVLRWVLKKEFCAVNAPKGLGDKRVYTLSPQEMIELAFWLYDKGYIEPPINDRP